MDKNKAWLTFVMVLYFICSFLLIRSSASPNDTTDFVWRFYSRIGFDMDRHIARALILSISLSCLFHTLIIIFRAIGNGWTSEGSKGAVSYLFFRALFLLGLSVLGVGALGDNVSLRRTPELNKELSILIGGLVLGGMVWLINDLLISIYVRMQK